MKSKLKFGHKKFALSFCITFQLFFLRLIELLRFKMELKIAAIVIRCRLSKAYRKLHKACNSVSVSRFAIN